jgi:hypothetical protein
MKQCQEAATHLPQNGIRKVESAGHVDSTVAVGSVRL